MLTTFLHDGELNRPTGSIVLDELLADARKLTGMNYQIVSRQAFKRYGLFGMRTRRVWRVGLYVEVGGMAPWQVITCAQTSETVQAYLYGLINGWDDAKRAERPNIVTAVAESKDQIAKAMADWDRRPQCPATSPETTALCPLAAAPKDPAGPPG